MSALRADADVAAALFRFAADDGEGGIPLYVRQIVGSPEGMKGSAENILYSEIRKVPPNWSKGFVTVFEAEEARWT